MGYTVIQLSSAAGKQSGKFGAVGRQRIQAVLSRSTVARPFPLWRQLRTKVPIVNVVSVLKSRT